MDSRQWRYFHDGGRDRALDPERVSRYAYLLRRTREPCAECGAGAGERCALECDLDTRYLAPRLD